LYEYPEILVRQIPEYGAAPITGENLVQIVEIPTTFEGNLNFGMKAMTQAKHPDHIPPQHKIQWEKHGLDQNESLKTMGILERGAHCDCSTDGMTHSD
jgi:hypothetical protein